MRLMYPDVIERRLAKLRAHLRTPRGRGDTAALNKLVGLQLHQDQSWHTRSRIDEMLKVLYPADSILPLGAPLRALGHPLLGLLRRH